MCGARKCSAPWPTRANTLTESHITRYNKGYGRNNASYCRSPFLRRRSRAVAAAFAIQPPFSRLCRGDSAAPQSIIVTSTTPAIRCASLFRAATRLVVVQALAGGDASQDLRLGGSVGFAGIQLSDAIQISETTGDIYRVDSVPVTFAVNERQPALDVVPDSLRLDERDLDDTLFVRNIGGGGPFSLHRFRAGL